MVTSSSPGRRIVFGLALLSAAPFGVARAQYPAGAVVQSLPGADDPAERLAGALRTLAVSPNDLTALIAAGQNALVLGDPNAAVGFFAHASEIAPRDGRVKAGLGGALVALEKPRDALRYFQEASALGVADVDLAEDRGLAYDLVGDPARAQRDYQTVLAARPGDDATRRRLALSQGISGNRAGAIATLDPLIRKRDIAAWRAQTFVLAMTGDAKGANDITRVMLPTQQAMLQPFLVRLAALSPADKARAVHFGEMPAAGRNYSGAQLAAPLGIAPTYAPPPVAVASAGASRPATAPVPAAAPSPVVAPQVAPQVTAVRPPVAAPVSPSAVSATGATRFVANGVPMRRIEHSTQEIFGLGMPRYEYVPDRRPARAPVAQRPAEAPAIVAAQTAPATPPQASVASSAPVAAPPAATTPPVIVQQPAPGEVAMPLGSSALAGHYDLPHESVAARAVPRSVQATARTAVPSAAPKPETRPASASVVQTAAASVDAAPANPTVVAARRRHLSAEAPVEVASVDRTSRRARAPVPPEDEETSPPASRDKAASSRSGKRKASDEAVDTDAKSARAKDRTKAHDEDEPKGKSKGKASKHTDDDSPPPKAKGGKHASDDDATPTKGHGKAAKSEPSSGPKVYVQVAGGANKADLDKAWAGVKAKAPDLMKGRKPSTTPLHATNRLLVGPFKSDDEAQAFVNKMAGKGLSGFTFKSGKGQKIETIGEPDKAHRDK